LSRINIADTSLLDNEINAAVEVLRSGALRQGPRCEEFEKAFSEKTGARHAVASSSGTSALHLAYMAFLDPGDEVLVPSFTFIATGSMVTMSGGTPVFCAVDRETFLLDLDGAESKITERTRAIAPVHLFGNACDIEAVKSFADRHNLLIVWDAAQAHGATYKGADVGSFGDFVCYSFYPTKNMFVGEGGMTLTDNAEYAEKMRFMRSHGQTGRYIHTMLGLNYRMTDVEGAIGVEQLKRLDSMLAIRRGNAAVLNKGLAGVGGVTPQKITPGAESAWHQYCVVVDPDKFGMDRDALAKRLDEQGITTGVHYPRGLHQQPVFIDLYGQTSLPNTEWLAERILALPVHHGLVEGDARRIVDAIVSAKG